MPIFQVEIEGKPYEVDAPDQASAVGGAQSYAKQTAITPDAIVRQLTRGIPVVGGAANQFAAIMDAATHGLLGRGSSAPTFAERRAENIATEEGRDVAFEQANPVTSTAAQLVGGVGGTAPLAATRLGATALGITGRSLGSRSIASGLSGAGIAAADAATRGQDPGEAALWGGAIGAPIPGIAAGVGAIARGVKGALAATPNTPQNIARIGRTDLPLTTGEATQDFTRIMDERAALRGGQGAPAQQVAQGFFEPRQAAIGQATENIKAGMSPTGAVVAGTPQEAGDIVSNSLIGRRTAAQQDVNRLYDVVRAQPQIVPADQLNYVGRRVKADLTTSTDRVVVNAKTTPAASQMLDYLDQWRGIPQDKANFLQRSTATGSTMAEIDQFRQELLAIKAAAANDADRRASGRIIGAFDKSIDQIAPSPELKAARAAHADYRKTFFSQRPGDDVGRIMERITGAKGNPPATAGEIAGWMYGAPKGTSVRVAERLQNIFGQGSPEFAAIKQGLLSHILESPAGVQWESQMLTKRLTDFLGASGRGRELSQAIFSKGERDELLKLASYLHQITPPSGAVNYSATAPVLKRIMGNLPRLLPLLTGLHVGGIPGMVVGAGIGAAQKGAGERLAARTTARSLYGTQPTTPLSPAAAAALRSLSLIPPAIAPQFNRP